MRYMFGLLVCLASFTTNLQADDKIDTPDIRRIEESLDFTVDFKEATVEKTRKDLVEKFVTMALAAEKAEVTKCTWSQAAAAKPNEWILSIEETHVPAKKKIAFRDFYSKGFEGKARLYCFVGSKETFGYQDRYKQVVHSLLADDLHYGDKNNWVIQTLLRRKSGTEWTFMLHILYTDVVNGTATAAK